MLALLGMVGGFLARMLPEAFRMVQDRTDKKHELEIMQLQIRQQEKGASDKLEAIGMQAYSAQAVELQKSYRSEIKYSGRYAASVRPTVTYLFIASFIGFKIAILYGLLNPTLPWQVTSFPEGAGLIWGETELAMLGAILSFWFGDRAIVKR